MRMGFIFTGAFWGLLLIVIGVLAILNTVFNMNMPVFRIVFAVFFIFIGISILVGGFHVSPDRNTVLFGERNLRVTTDPGPYNVIFGQAVIDYSGHPGSGRSEANVIFADGTLLLDKEIPARVEVHAAFSSARMPDGSSISFGEYVYRTPAFQEGEKHLTIKASVVFGDLSLSLR
ncbi:MAG: hypothetical protein AB1576_04375 [Bacillota bacterium]